MLARKPLFNKFDGIYDRIDVQDPLIRGWVEQAQESNCNPSI